MALLLAHILVRHTSNPPLEGYHADAMILLQRCEHLRDAGAALWQAPDDYVGVRQVQLDRDAINAVEACRRNTPVLSEQCRCTRSPTKLLKPLGMVP